jgi:hypothetical protein
MTVNRDGLVRYLFGFGTPPGAYTYEAAERGADDIISRFLTSYTEGLRELSEAATPGPWETTEEHGRDITDEHWSFLGIEGRPHSTMNLPVAWTYAPGYEDNERAEADAAFIVAAVNRVRENLATEQRALDKATNPREGLIGAIRFAAVTSSSASWGDKAGGIADAVIAHLDVHHPAWRQEAEVGR